MAIHQIGTARPADRGHEAPQAHVF
jgi:hypothetical protein